MKKHVWIVGANGQLGSEMRVLSPQHTQFDYTFTGSADLDIRDADAVMQFVDSRQIDIIVNCAAYTAVDRAEEDAEQCDILNRLAPGYLAKAIARRNGQLIHISTDYVFDGTGHIPYKEDAPTCPNSVYGRTKLAGEQAVTEHCRQAMIIRTSWLYSSFGRNFVKTMLRLGKERDALGVVFDQVGTPTSARSLAAAIYVAMEQGIVPGIYHYSNEGVCSWYDFARAIHRLAGITTCHVRPIHTEEYPTPAARPPYSVLDKSKFKETYSVVIPHWIECLEDCIRELAEKE